MSTGATSPTLILQVAAPQALGAFEELRRAIAAVKVELASLGKGTSSVTGSQFKLLQAEVKELRAALEAGRLENERLAKSIEQSTQASINAKAKEVAAARDATRVKKALAEEEVAAAEKAEQRRLQIQLRSGQMTAQRQLAANASIEASLAQHLATQERMRDAALDREFQRVQAAYARNDRLTEQARARNLREAERAAAAQAALAERGARAQAVGQAATGGGIVRSAGRGAIYGAGAPGYLSYGASIPALVAGAGVAAYTAASISQGSEFQYQTAFTGGLGQYKADELARIRTELMKMGTDSVYGPLELAKAMRVLEMAGVGASDALKILPVATKVAQQGETDLKDSSETLVSVMNQFGLKVDDVQRIGDAMSKTAAVTQASMPTLMAAMKQATGLQRFGVGLEDALSGMGLLAKQGITGTSAGTFFRRYVEETYQPRSLDAQRAMRYLAFNPYNEDGSRRPFREVQSELMGKLGSFDEESRNKLMGTMFDVRSIKQVSAFITDLTGEFDKLRKQIDDSKGSLGSFSKAISEETKTLWEQVKSNFQVLLIETFQQIEQPLNSFLRRLRDGLASLSDHSKLEGQVKAFDDSIERYRKAGGTEDGTSFYSRQLQAALAGRAALQTELDAGKPASERHAMNPSVYNFRAAEMAGTTGGALGAGALAAGAGGKRAPKFITNPLGAQEDQQLAQAQEAEAMAKMHRDRQRIEDQANFEQRLLEEKHRFGLVSEEDYTNQIDALNQKRADSAVQAVKDELSYLAAARNKRLEAKQYETPAEKERNETKAKDLATMQDRLQREADFQRKRVEIARQGAIKMVEAETETIVRKHREAGTKYREGLQVQLSNGLRPEAVAAGYAAEFQTRESFAADMRSIDELIAKKSSNNGQGMEDAAGNLYSPGDTGEVAALRKRKQLLKETMDIEVQANREAARAAKETERSYTYGRDTLFVQYVDAATNSAQQAREVWGASLQGMSQNLTQMIVKGKADWRSFGEQIVSMLIEIQIRRQIAGVMGLFMPTQGGGAGGPYGSSPVSPMDVPLFGQNHTGGIVGREVSGFSAVHPAVFSGAPRFHTGGLVGDEMPIIAKKGEGVFTPAQMRAMAPAAGGAMNVRVELENHGTPQQASSVEPRFDAEGLVLKVVTRDIARGGPLSRTLQGAYNLQRSPTA
jgi:TP901 family phage tail tape measure protein/lambda family phage tail tape measure protein